MKHFETIVMGVGCMGAAACAHLAQRGRSVLGLDQFGIPNDHGSSGHQSRAFRLAYYEHADYVPLLKRSRELFLELNDEAQATVFHASGGLYIGPEGGEFVEASQAAAELHGIEFERLDAASIRNRFPTFEIPDHFVGLVEPGAGWIVPERAIETHVKMARRAGADIRSNVTVQSWTTDGQGVRINTSTDEFTADRLIITCGPWALRHLPDLQLRVSRQVLGWVEPQDPEPLACGSLPIWAIELEDQSLLYGFPMASDGHGPAGFKLARHWAAQSCDPESVNRSPEPGDESDFLPYLKQLLPGAAGPVREMRICLYTNTTDGHFIVDKHPDHEQIIIATGFSGHGFKFQPVIGEILADLSMTGQTSHSIEFLGLSRFR
ncbi:MAG: N-methyl-L-tryptophan oxidase [Phycisphaerales bacterium]|nr:N-methyl-L-tryptophan oxidase [Phycisphaerales bacterium]